VSVRTAKLASQPNAGLAARICYTIFLLTAGCGAPGEPTAPAPIVAAPITDLTARQAGDGVQLKFSMPRRSANGERLLTPPAIEILRGKVKPDGSPDPKSLRVVYTIPGALENKYLVGDNLQFTDALPPEEIKAHPGQVFTYAVRTRTSRKRASADSNLVTVRVFPAPQRIASIEARLTETAIELSWPPVERTSAGDPLPSAPTYNIYRAELDDATAELATRDFTQTNAASNLHLLASQSQTTYSDQSFEFGKTYAYIVRSTIVVEGAQLESGDSPPAIVAARDTFSPAPPQDLAAAILPGGSEKSIVVDLSWSINVEPDFSGYRVYRSERQDAPGTLLTPELLPTPALRDTSVLPAHRYWYTVRAVDRAGNESAPSPSLSVDIPQQFP
jgi:hypothetical protein